MYWPIGQPKTYAASKHTAPAPSRNQSVSNDGLDNSSEAAQDITSQHECTDGAQHIVDIKIARGGQVFASITESALTVWQTKASVSVTVPWQHPSR